MFFKRYTIAGHSMEPSYPKDSYVLVYRTSRVYPGDVIAFREQRDSDRVLIKRIIAQTADDTFEVAGDNKADSSNPERVCLDEIVGKVVLSY